MSVCSALSVQAEVSQQRQGWRKWQCGVCGFIYDESQGWPDDGIAPGTRWEDVPDDWLCPDCGTGKQDFEMIPVS